MYPQTYFTTSVRGSGMAPTTAAKWALGVIGFMKPALGVRFTSGLATFYAAGFLAGAAAFFTAGFLAAGFFVVAILVSPTLGLHLNRFQKHSSKLLSQRRLFGDSRHQRTHISGLAHRLDVIVKFIFSEFLLSCLVPLPTSRF